MEQLLDPPQLGNPSDIDLPQGIEVYVHKRKNPYSDQSIWLAHTLQRELNKNLGFKSRGVKSANFQVLRETAQTCPSILIELGFLSNEVESNYHEKENNIRAIALAILKGIEKATWHVQ